MESRTDLDSHANMPLVGQNYYIISDSGTFAEVNAFLPEYETKNISILDATL